MIYQTSSSFSKINTPNTHDIRFGKVIQNSNGIVKIQGREIEPGKYSVTMALKKTGNNNLNAYKMLLNNKSVNKILEPQDVESIVKELNDMVNKNYKKKSF
jgi:hypothetical protein